MLTANKISIGIHYNNYLSSLHAKIFFSQQKKVCIIVRTQWNVDYLDLNYVCLHQQKHDAHMHSWSGQWLWGYGEPKQSDQSDDREQTFHKCSY